MNPLRSTDSEMAKMRATLAELRADPSKASAPPPGWGDRLHNVLGPIGEAINWPCMKGDGTTDLKPATLCFYLRQTFNKI